MNFYDISEAVKSLRTLYGFKQKEFAERIGVSTSYLCEVEKGKKTPTIHVLEKIADLFDIQVSILMILAEKLDPANEISKVGVEKLPEMVRLIVKIRKLQRDIRKKGDGR